MSNPVGGSPKIPKSSETPGQKPVSVSKASYVAQQALGSSGSSQPSPRELKMVEDRPLEGGVDLSDKSAVEQELKAWKSSLPFWGIFSEADAIIEQLLKLPLDKSFELIMKPSDNSGNPINSLPNVLQNCKALHVDNYRSLRTLPNLPNCVELHIDTCYSLKSLPDLPKIMNLYAPSCISLKAIGDLLKCERLNVHGCSSLITIGKLPACRELDIIGCSALTTKTPDQLRKECNLQDECDIRWDDPKRKFPR